MGPISLGSIILSSLNLMGKSSTKNKDNNQVQNTRNFNVEKPTQASTNLELKVKIFTIINNDLQSSL